MELALFTLCISIFLYFDFLGKQPFITNRRTKIHFSLYLLFIIQEVFTLYHYYEKIHIFKEKLFYYFQDNISFEY